ncbi:MAG: PEP-CTERM sorting domain-containing protein [Planctomycetota bacterium]
MYRRLTTLALFTPLAVTTHATAELIVYEGFDYSSPVVDGTDIAGLSGGTPTGSPGFNGSVWRDGNNGTRAEFVFEETGLAYTDGLGNELIVGGGSTVEPDTGNTSVYFREFDKGSGLLDTGNAVYFSFLTAVVGDGSRVFGLTTSDTNFGFRLFRDAGFWRVQIGGVGVTSTVSTDNFDGLVVGRITMKDGNDDFEIWFNPDDISSEAALGTADIQFLDGANTPNFNRFRLEGGNFPTDLQFDEIRLGTTFADVVPIPEPGSLALIGLGGLVIAARRRN